MLISIVLRYLESTKYTATNYKYNISVSKQTFYALEQNNYKRLRIKGHCVKTDVYNFDLGTCCSGNHYESFIHTVRRHCINIVEITVAHIFG